MPGSRTEAVEPRGIYIYRASRLEALLEPLSALLRVSAPQDPLQMQTVIAAHPGMKQWLTGALAQTRGAQGIVANLEVLLPSSWIDRLAQQHLGVSAVALPRWQRVHLRWNLYQWLDAPARIAGLQDARLAHFLDPQLSDAEKARRRFQLADRLAALYSRYQVYRTDWLEAWQQGDFGHASRAHSDKQLIQAEKCLLAPLWRHAVNEIGMNRSALTRQLMTTLAARPADDVSPVLHVFGASHLAPAELEMLRVYARNAWVVLYLPDPCRDYWGVLDNGDARAWQQVEMTRMTQADGGDWWHPQRHELLSRWGRLGQHFFAALLEGDVHLDSRHGEDESDARPTTRLARVQESIRQLDEGLMQPAQMAVETGQACVLADEYADDSLRIHLCHTAQRELEVLRDVLLSARQKGIQPGQMLVMAPDMRRYLPLLPAIFGPAGDVRSALPYHVADVPLQSRHGLLAAFASVLGLAGKRIGVADVLDLMARPEVAARFGLDAAALEGLESLLENSHIAWSLSPSHRARFGVPARAENGFAWGMDRMLAGYVMSDEAGLTTHAEVLPDDTELLPLTGVSGTLAEAIGAFDTVLQHLSGLCERSEQTLPASEWVRYFDALGQALFAVDHQDRAANDAREALRRAIAQLQTETEVAGIDPLLHYAVASERLQAALAEVPERQPFLLGGITFCGMVPQRAIPFRFIAVLGLDENEFPRSTDDAGLDLMSRLRRLGDRDQRLDDRYLFLETVMSAREQLHLSFVGEGVSDGKPRNPATPLAELMAVLMRADGACSPELEKARPWQIKHPLQPFDSRYVDGSDPRLCRWRLQPVRALPMLQQGTSVPEVPQQLPVQDVRRYWQRPAEQLLTGRMRVSLEALASEQWCQDEPMDSHLDALTRHQVIHRLLQLESTQALESETAPDWLRLDGRLPVGSAGDEAWRNLRDVAAAVRNALLQRGCLQGALHAAQRQRLSVSLLLPLRGQQVQLHGTVELWSHPQGGLQLLPLVLPGMDKDKPKDAKLDFGKRIPAWMDWLLARLHLPTDTRLHFDMGQIAPDPWVSWVDGLDAQWQRGELGEDWAREKLAGLLEQWHKASEAPLHYFPRTSWEAWQRMAKGESSEAIGQAVSQAWLGSFNHVGERDHAPGYTRLLAGEEMFAIGSPALSQLQETARELAGLLEMSKEACDA